jgi:hypothetical protein
VPILATFFGIIVRMWHDDHPPHKAASIVQEWCLRHQDELLANWERAQKFEPLERIPGADQDA